MQVTFDSFAEEVIGFLSSCWVESQTIDDMPPIDPDTDLFESGVLDSLLVVELLAFIEDAFEIVIDVTRIDDPAVFFTLRGIYEGLDTVTV